MKKILWIGMALLAVALVALAADNITGKWTFEMARGMGRGGPGGGGPGGGGPGAGGPGGGAPGGAAAAPRIATLELKADGAKLTGTLTQPGFGRGGDTPPPPTATPIANGKVDGNNISFDVSREMMGNTMVTKYKGVVNGAELKLTSTMENPMGGDAITQEMTAKKQ
jgi:hypothetical protein